MPFTRINSLLVLAMLFGGIYLCLSGHDRARAGDNKNMVTGGNAPAAAPSNTPPANTARRPGKPADQQSKKRLISLVVASMDFQETAITNFPKALKYFSSGKGKLLLHGINTKIWSEKTFQYGWMAFFNSAVRILGKNPDRLPMVGYYNPYSDTMLVTVWKRKKGIFGIIDAEMVMGDLVRRSDKKPSYEPVLARLLKFRKKRHAAIGFSVARTILAFEKRFSDTNWRERLGFSSAKSEIRELNYLGVSIMAKSHLGNLGSYIDPAGRNKKLVKSREIVSRTIMLLAVGKVDEALDSPRKAPTAIIRKLFKKLPREWYESLRTSIIIGTSTGYIVYLTPYKTTNISLSLTIKNQNGKSYLDRMDMIDFQSFYTSVKKYQQPKQGG